jgi:hypothetical protein
MQFASSECTLEHSAIWPHFATLPIRQATIDMALVVRSIPKQALTSAGPQETLSNFSIEATTAVRIEDATLAGVWT